MSAAENSPKKAYEPPQILATFTVAELMQEAAVCHHYSWHQNHRGGNGKGRGKGKGKGK